GRVRGPRTVDGDPDWNVDADDRGVHQQRVGEALATEGVDDAVVLEHDDGPPAASEVDARDPAGARSLGQRDEIPLGIAIRAPCAPSVILAPSRSRGRPARPRLTNPPWKRKNNRKSSWPRSGRTSDGDGGGRIRTSVGLADGFTARSLWPLGHTPGNAGLYRD